MLEIAEIDGARAAVPSDFHRWGRRIAAEAGGRRRAAPAATSSSLDNSSWPRHPVPHARDEIGPSSKPNMRVVSNRRRSAPNVDFEFKTRPSCFIKARGHDSPPRPAGWQDTLGGASPTPRRIQLGIGLRCAPPHSGGIRCPRADGARIRSAWDLRKSKPGFSFTERNARRIRRAASGTRSARAHWGIESRWRTLVLLP